jgi:hypothetical protein
MALQPTSTVSLDAATSLSLSINFYFVVGKGNFLFDN